MRMEKTTTTTQQHKVTINKAGEVVLTPNGSYGGVKRSEILFFVDSRMSNMNGDPDENKPRYDSISKRILVTEFRLKRTIRKYLNEVMGYPILLRQEIDEDLEKEEGVQAFRRLANLAKDYFFVEQGKAKLKEGGKIRKVRRDDIIRDHIDLRYFGILFAVGKGEFSDKDRLLVNFKIVGPVQFKMAQSMNLVNEDTDIMRIGMTSLVPNTKNEAGVSLGGGFGEKWIVRYVFAQYQGFINNNVAKEVNLTENDINTMFYAMWNGTDNLATTSKYGQKSRLLIRVNYRNNGYIGDLDILSKLEYDSKKPLENITQVKLDITELLDTLAKHKDIVESIDYYQNKMLVCKYKQDEGTFEEIVEKWGKIPTNQIDFRKVVTQHIPQPKEKDIKHEQTHSV